MTPIIRARRIAFPSLRWDLTVKRVCVRGWIWPISVIYLLRTDALVAMDTGSTPSW